MIIGVAAQQLAPADSAPLGRFAPSLRAAAELGAVSPPVKHAKFCIQQKQ